ncbi:MAG: helix-turn-helix transcriptional regulator [Clostridia bacterium]|nr:helix-turn-helix transcriptional regulator [Clostridia bacterium]
MSIGKRIKVLRNSATPKLSQEAFAESIGKKRPAIAVYETDRVVPDDSVLLLISKTYGVRYEWLKTGEEPMYPPETDDLLERVTRILEGESPHKLELMKMIMDMPDELLDWVYNYYQQKKSSE